MEHMCKGLAVLIPSEGCIVLSLACMSSDQISGGVLV